MPTTSRITFQEYAIQPFKKLDIPSKVAEFGKKFPWKALGYTAALGVTVPVTGATCLALVAIYPLGIAGAAPVGGLLSAFLVYKICTSLFGKKGNDKQPDNISPPLLSPPLPSLPLPPRPQQNNNDKQPNNTPPPLPPRPQQKTDIISTPSNTPAATASTQRKSSQKKALPEHLRTSIQNLRPYFDDETQDPEEQDISQPGEKPGGKVASKIIERNTLLNRVDEFLQSAQGQQTHEDADEFAKTLDESSWDD